LKQRFLRDQQLRQFGLSYDTLAVRIMRMDIAVGKILGPRESPAHWPMLRRNGDIYVASLTGNMLGWHQGWVTGMGKEAPGMVK
jgi:hypothetical protein